MAEGNRDDGEKSLKSRNNPKLALFLAIHALVFLALTGLYELAAVERLDWVQQLREMLPKFGGISAAVALLVGLANNLIPPSAKAVLVFWRLSNVLPGHRAFSEYADSQPVSREKLQEKFGPLPTDPKEQNTMWFDLYRQQRSVPHIKDNHQEFLLLRDVCTLSLLLAVGLGTAGAFLLPTITAKIVYVVVLIGLYLASALAARNSGVRFVKNVLAESQPVRPLP